MSSNRFTETEECLFNIEHSKRFVIIFNMFSIDEHNHYSLYSSSITQYDKIEEAKDEMKMINEMYKSQIKTGNVTYCLLDYKDCRIKKLIGKFVKVNNKVIDSINNLELIDRLFRGKDEVPYLYNWDNGEYDGWLQYRWGDGKNAISKN